VRVQLHTVAGQPVKIRSYEGDQDFDAFAEWLLHARPVLAVDTETTGLDIYSPAFEVRLVQFGDAHGAWVLPARFREPIRRALLGAKKLVAHNATYDLMVIDQCLDIPLEDLHPKTIDTRILAHIIDPREPQDGGIGAGLKEQARYYVDENAPDGDKALKAVFAENGWKGAEGWQAIPLDHPAYTLYAGLDTILTARLYDAQLPHLAGFERLSRFEHAVARLLARMERRGLRLDVEYTEKLQHQLDQEVTDNTATIIEMVQALGCRPLTPRGQKDLLDGLARACGWEPPKRRASKAPQWAKVSADSRAVITKALLAMGEELTETTATGQVSIGKTVLNELCDVNVDGSRLDLREPNPLAVAVKAAKRATKWRASYVDTMLELKDADDRVHPRIAGLKARTARMAISAPPLQQLPSSDSLIRSCFIADEDQLIISSDFDQIELRLLAAFAEETQMQAAIRDGVDLHDFTATLMFGSGFTKKQRKLAKVAAFARVYGGGAGVIAMQTGISVGQAKDVVATYEETFPGIKQFAWDLQGRTERNDFNVVTPLYGRRLPVDEGRVYSAGNYLIQSTARDIFAQALLDLEAEGLEEHLLLPVHDEVVAQAPADIADDVALAIGEVMTRSFMGVPITASGEVYGRSWGSGYV